MLDSTVASMSGVSVAGTAAATDASTSTVAWMSGVAVLVHPITVNNTTMMTINAFIDGRLNCF